MLGEVVPVERRPRRGVDEGGGARLGHRLGAELADEAHEAGQHAGPLGELAQVAAVPAEPEVAVGPVELGEVGSTPLWATVGRVGSACSNARFSQRSSTDLFHVGSCWATNRRSRARRVAVELDCGASATGSSWAHHWTIDGWWPSALTASRAWRTASRRIWWA